MNVPFQDSHLVTLMEKREFGFVSDRRNVEASLFSSRFRNLIFFIFSLLLSSLPSSSTKKAKMGSTSLELNSAYNQPKRKRFNFSLVVLLLSLSFSSILYLSIGLTSKSESAFHDSPSPRVLSTLEESVTRCKNLNLTPRPPPNFHSRTRSDRYEPGSPPIVIRNATLWTGNDNGTEVLKSMDVFLNKGIISNISKSSSMKAALKDSMEIDAGGRWLTPGIIDMHVHLGVGPLPSLPASEDVNTRTALSHLI